MTQRREKVIKNALVLMICLSKYNALSSLEQVKTKDAPNFTRFFKEELHYEVVQCGDVATADDVLKFLDEVISTFELDKNPKQFDGLIVIICGHATTSDELIASDGNCVKIETIRNKFSGQTLTPFLGFPKLFILNTYIDGNESLTANVKAFSPTNSFDTKITFTNTNDEFVMIRSTVVGSLIPDSVTPSYYLNEAFMSFYKKHDLSEMIKMAQTKICERQNRRHVEIDATAPTFALFLTRKI
ncbi:hypothetical protein RFI_12560 [Reticulomyxa filosa]|uniref:Peptidase C14 caspase domain-containing protein n=1 Tax=Reticulomyxa filosa TaxID=46433 RepID=X6NFB4_RETFI|nr:hypothetical protein RFI_12560 [Reticulomyxa filosa]|eukprot:ETO24598.1 hypothetical protein RFI_12560 [Reticulomyxa filosa]